MWAAPGSSWHVSGGWLCPFQVGQEMGTAVPAPSPCHRPVPPGRRDFPEGRRPKVTGSWVRMVLHKYRGVKALQVGFSSSGGGHAVQVWAEKARNLQNPRGWVMRAHRLGVPQRGRL